jgi:hypothetical protein
VWHTSSVKRLAHKFPGLITEDGRLAGVEGGGPPAGGADSPTGADAGERPSAAASAMALWPARCPQRRSSWHLQDLPDPSPPARWPPPLTPAPLPPLVPASPRSRRWRRRARPVQPHAAPHGGRAGGGPPAAPEHHRHPPGAGTAPAAQVGGGRERGLRDQGWAPHAAGLLLAALHSPRTLPSLAQHPCLNPPQPSPNPSLNPAPTPASTQPNPASPQPCLPYIRLPYTRLPSTRLPYTPRRNLFISMGAVLYVMYPALANSSLSIFACKGADSGSGPFAANHRAAAKWGYWTLNMLQVRRAGGRAGGRGLPGRCLGAAQMLRRALLRCSGGQLASAQSRPAAAHCTHTTPQLTTTTPTTPPAGVQRRHPRLHVRPAGRLLAGHVCDRRAGPAGAAAVAPQARAAELHVCHVGLWPHVPSLPAGPLVLGGAAAGGLVAGACGAAVGEAGRLGAGGGCCQGVAVCSGAGGAGLCHGGWGLHARLHGWRAALRLLAHACWCPPTVCPTRAADAAPRPPARLPAPQVPLLLLVVLVTLGRHALSFAGLAGVLTVLLVFMLVLHALQPLRLPAVYRVQLVSAAVVAFSGFVCLYFAQVRAGAGGWWWWWSCCCCWRC